MDAHINAGSGFTIAEEPSKADEAIVRLAKLSTPEYERVRMAEANRMGYRAHVLDKLVQQARNSDDTQKLGQGRPLYIPRPEPWPQKVSGAQLLAEIAAFLTRHVFLPPGASDALALWVVHTHCFDRFRHTPRVALTSPEKRCGKTTALDTLELLVCAPLATANVTAAAMFRTVEIAKPTLLIDEADSFLGDNEELRGAINAGHKRGGQMIRCVGDDAEPRAFSVFAPAAVAAIGRLPGTIADRSINIGMQRATRAERPAPLDAAAEAEGERLARMCARWAMDHTSVLPDDPRLPPALFNRAADNWRPLFAIAWLAGGGWPERLELASSMLTRDDDEGHGVRLLADIQGIFAARATDKIASADLCEALAVIDTSPWAEANHGRPVTPTLLARLLKPFSIRPATRRQGAETFKGYERAAFAETWRRYLPDGHAEGSDNPSHRHNPQKTTAAAPPEPSQSEFAVTGHIAREPRETIACDGVTAKLPGAGRGKGRGRRWPTN